MPGRFRSALTLLARGWLVLAMAMAVAGRTEATPAAAAHEAEVLLLLSYDPGFPTSPKIIDGVRKGFGDRPVHLSIAYMHTRFERSPAYLARFADWLAFQVRRTPPAVVIAADDTAFQFALAHGELLAHAPVVFLGVNDVEAARAADRRPDVTGIVENVSVARTIALIHQAMPKARTLHVIADASPGGQADLATAMRSREAVPGLFLKPYLLQQMTWSALGQALERIPPSEPILLLSAYKDSAGHTKRFEQGAAFLLGHAKGPIFHLWEHGIAEGFVGGWVMSHRIHGQIAATMAAEILDGKPAGDIPVIYDSPNRPVFNATALARWHIDRDALPPDAELLDPPPSLIGDYPHQFAGSLLIFIVMAALMLALLRAHRQRSALFEQTTRQHALLTGLINASPDMIFFKDTDGRFQLVNTAMTQLMGKSSEQIIGTTDYDHFPTDLAEDFRRVDAQVMATATPNRRTEMVVHADGPSDILETVKAPARLEDGTVLGIIGIARRVTAEHQTSDRLQLAAQVFEHAAEGIIITAPDGTIEMVNPAFTRITGYSAEEAVGKTPSILHSGRHGRDFYERMWAAVNATDLWQGEIWNRDKSGRVYPEWLNISPVRDEHGKVAHYLGIFSDISAVKHTEAKLEHMAHHDALTGLPNRILLGDRIGTALKRAQRADRMVAIAFLDLDRFKDINDSFGHAIGDKVLKQVAQRLRETVRDEDTVARLGGDEFVILMEEIEDTLQAEKATERILTCLNPPILLDHQEFFIGGSLGISIFPRDGTDPEALIRNADTAMYQAKHLGRNTIQRYSEQQTESARHRMRLETALRRAVEQARFEMWLQPQVSLADGALTGFEALCRWPDPEQGMIPPAEFIPVAEATGMIMAIGEFMLRQAARQTVDWRKRGLNPPRIAVNVSGRQLRRLDFLSTLCTILEEEACRPEWIELEVTESDILKDAEPAIATLHGLREMGIGLSLDDFGTGFSSLSYLKRLPIETIKIDRSFIDGLPADGNDRAIVQAVLAMGRSLGMRVLAEGVETPAQASALRLMGCSLAQGYRFGRPQRPDALEDDVLRGRVTVGA